MLGVLGHILAYPYYSNPVFIIGAGRSGTTAITYALGCHPRIFAIENECPFIGHVGRLAHFIEPDQFPEYYLENLFIPKHETIRRIARLCFESCRGKNFGLADSLRRLVRADFVLLQSRRWCAKTFPHHDEFLGLLRLFPKARFLYILRNGIDMVQSRTRFANFKEHGFLDHCRTWTMNVDKYAYVTKYSDSALEIRHDQLVSEPEKVFQQVYDLLELDYHPGPIDFIGGTIVHPLDKPTKEDVNVKDVLEKRTPAWMKWTDEEKEIFKKVCGKNMHQLGYDIPF